MLKRHWITGIILALLLGAALFGLRFTREPEAVAEPAKAAETAKDGKEVKDAKGARPDRPRRQRSVNQQALITARQLGPLALTQDEKALARQAERLANHEVDLAFSEAIRQALENPAPLTSEATQLKELRDKAATAVDSTQALIQRLSREIPTAPAAQRAALEDQISLAKAQEELYKDEFEEAQENLERAGGDPQAQVRRLKEAHEAADRDSRLSSVAEDDKPLPAHSLLARLKAWNLQRRKLDRLAQAQKESLERVQRLTERKDAFAKTLESGKETREATKQWAKDISGARRKEASAMETESAAWEMRRIAAEQRRLTAFAKRIQDHRALSEVYGQWQTLAQGLHRTAQRELLKSLAGLVGIFLGAFLLNRLVDLLYYRTERKRQTQIGSHTVTRFVVQLLAVVVAIFFVAGIPAQASTVFGLAGAGLTVALKDFIVAFFGWFLLMGRNGLRVGDWVEIKGVGGEVVELGPLRTVLLETGDWNDSGHPTGRRVSFVNSYAMGSHFFNFTTSGQWMWDELKVMLQPGTNPYPLLEGIQKLVTELTAKNAAEAEEEWKRTTRRYRVRAFTATPGLQIHSTAQGLEIRARYITRAFERHETRKQLNEAVVELMHGKRAEATVPAE